MQIRVDPLQSPEIIALLQEHNRDMRLHSPEESVHALDLDALRDPGITFWSVWSGADLAGCGALKQLDSRNGEIKSMRTASAFLRRGVAVCLLGHILQVARDRGYAKVWLETGAPEAFMPARKLYTRFGFEYCDPFGTYTEDPYSLFMCRSLGAKPAAKPAPGAEA